MRSPSFTIITVCFNAERTIATTMMSVGEQRYEKIEHLIVDGASVDRTLAVVRRYARPGSRIISERDRGIYDAMNKGIASATGEIIAFLNADDFYIDDRVLGEVADRFSAGDVDAVFGNVDYVDASASRILRRWRSRPFRQGAVARAWIPPHPAFFLRSSVFKHAGVFNLDYKVAGDFDLLNRLFTRVRIRSCHLPRALVRMRIGGASNRSMRAILRGNLEIGRSLIGTFGFIPPVYPLLKIADRWRQFSMARKMAGVILPSAHDDG